MSLRWQSVQKLLRDHIKGQDPLQVSQTEALDFVKALIPQVETLPGVTYNPQCHEHNRFHDPSAKPSETMCCCLLLQEVQERWYNDKTHLHFLNTPNQRLHLKLHGHQSEPISNSEEVIAFLRAFHARVEQQKAQLAKRKKQRDLKLHAILAQVRKMAKEDQFDFATSADHVKLNLGVRLSEQDYFVIVIPFKQIKEVLPKLRPAIQALRETYNSGVRFKTHLSQGHRLSQWIHHQDISLD